MAIKYKYPDLERQVRKAAPSVRMILNAFAAEVWRRYRKDVVVTSVYRPPEPTAEAQTVHSTVPCRGIDVRVNGLWDKVDKRVVVGPHGTAETPSVEEAAEATASINRRYVYDAQRPEKVPVIFGDLDPLNGHWNHAHLQGHPGTRLVVSQQPEVFDEDDNEIAEDFIAFRPLHPGGEGRGWTDRLWARTVMVARSDEVRSVARRVGKGISAVATAAVMSSLGMPAAAVAAVVPAYLATEKGLNKAAENKTGRPTNFDWVSLLFKLFGLLISFARNRK